MFGLMQVDGRWVCLQNPVEVITAVSPSQILPALQKIETAVKQHNLYAAGFITYEAAAAFDLAVHPSSELPLLWFGLFAEKAVSFQPSAFSPQSQSRNTHHASRTTQVPNWKPSLAFNQYDTAIQTIKNHIARGSTYQVNYTFHLQRQFTDDPFAYFQALAAAQQAAYMAYLDIGRFAICSASPELFFKLDGNLLTGKPMKGTAVRGHTPEQDKANITWLAQSAKNRAENVMIVDMIRNDMGQIAQTGSVQVPELFAIERYPTLLQMTSTVTAQTKRPLSEIIAAMFPCASITGAPKVRTMEIIKELEPQPRGLYTGSIGFIAPGRQAQFNVAIRTVVIDKKTHTADYGVGSGIVWDSVAADEFAECQVKASVLTEKRPSFQIFESILWEPEAGYFLLDEHMARLGRAAEYFVVDVGDKAVRQQLADFAQTLTEPCKVRLLLAQDGKTTVEAVPLAHGALPEPIRVGLAREPIHSDTVWLYHKTTYREMYNAARASRPDCDEVLLWNERGEITEAGSSNVVVKLDGQWLTPSIESGLLAGTYREWLLANGRIQTQTITIHDLQNAQEIALINSVRRWRKAILIDKDS